MADISSDNISFSNLKSSYVAGGNTDADGNTSLKENKNNTKISLSFFRNAKFTDNTIIPSGNNEISIRDHFLGKIFGKNEYTTDTFRAKSNYSSFSSKLVGTIGESSYVGSITGNKNVQLNTGNQGEAYSSLLLVHVDSEGNDKFLNVDRNDSNCIDGAEIWFKVRSHNPHNTVQFGLIKKDFDQSWSNQISLSAMSSRHGAYADRINVHGAGYHPYAGSRDDITSTDTIVSPAWTENNESLVSEDDYGNPSPRSTITYSQVSSQGITNKFHNIIGITAGTHKTSNALRSDTGWTSGGTTVSNEFMRERHFFKNWPNFSLYNYPGYRGTGPGGDPSSEISLNCNHGLKIKWYEKTLDVYVTAESPYLTPQSGTSNWTNDTDSSTGLEGLFSGMYVTAQSGTGTLPTSTTSASSGDHTQETLINVFIGEINTNRITMYQERGASSLTQINGTKTGNATITISGYLYWTLVTPHDTTATGNFSNTNYNNPKIIGPPHTVLPRWHVSTPGNVSQAYKTKEWAFYIGDTTSSGSNYFQYHLRNTLPGGTPFSYSVTYSSYVEPAGTGVYPGGNNTLDINADGYLLLNNGTNSTSLQTLTANLNTDVVGSSVVGKTGRILLHFRTGKNFYSDIQIINMNVNGSTISIGGTGSGIQSYTNWRTKTLIYSSEISNDAYSEGDYSNYSSLYNVGTNSHVTGYQNRRWQRMSSGIPGSGNVGRYHASAYVMFESSAVSGGSKRSNILVSPEITFTSDYFSTQVYAWASSGSNIFTGILRLGVELT